MSQEQELRTFQNELNTALILMLNMTPDERAKVLLYHSAEAVLQDYDLEDLTDRVLFHYGI